VARYATLDMFAEYTRDSAAATDAAQAAAALLAGEQMVDDFCQRTFVVAGAASARVYTPATSGSDILRIHDCTSITSVVEDGVTIPAGAYQAEPLNAIAQTGQARPYEQLRRLNSTWDWDYGQASVTVTAAWGWAAVPDQVVAATLIIAKDVLQQRNNNSGVAGFGEYGAIRVRMNPLAINLLQPLRRVEALGIG
jgi:hypothetical protein